MMMQIWGNGTWAPDDTKQMRDMGRTFGAFLTSAPLKHAAAAAAAAAAAEEQHRQFLFQVTGEVLHVVWDKMQEKPCSRSLKVVTGAEEDERLYSNTELCCSGWYVFKIAIILSSQSTRLEGNLQSSRS
jgi:hypothetical protein